MPELTSKERADCRRMVKNSKPHVVVGKNGLTDTLIAEIDRALKKESVIKVRLQAQSREEMPLLCEAIENRSNSTLCGITGSTAVFFRPKEA